MTLPYNINLKERSRELRRHMTEAEKKIWERIKSKHLKGYGFVRQKPIGNYIVDFYCRTARLVIEIDGAEHYSEEGKENDKERDAVLRGLDLNILRFSNSEVMSNIDTVIKRIFKELP